MKIWQAFVEAKEVITDQYAQPFEIKYQYTGEDNDHHFTYSENPSSTVKEQIKKIFPEISEEDISLKDGYFLYPLDSMDFIKNEALESLREFSDANYYDFIPRPCITGKVQLLNNPFTVLSEEIGLDISSSGNTFATLEQINTIDEVLKEHPRLEKMPTITAITKISASKHLIDQEFNKANKYLREEVQLHEFTPLGITKDIVIRNSFIKECHSNWILENTLYARAFHRIIISPHKEAFQSFLEERNQRGIFFRNEDKSDLSGIILPDPFKDEFHFLCEENISLEDLKFEVLFRRKSFENYLGEGNFEIRHEHVFKIDNQKFLAYIKRSTPHNLFQISANTETIAFDFNSGEDLERHITELNKLEEIFYYGFDNNHKYKIKFNHLSPLKDFESTLQAIPSVQTYIIEGGTKLLFRCYFDEADEIPLLQTRLINCLNQLDKESYKWSFDHILEHKMKYSLHFREEEYSQEAINRLLYLLEEEIILCESKDSVGKLTKVKFPEIIINSETDTEDLKFIENQRIRVCGSLKGEQDKIKRLKDTVSAIFEEKSEIVNAKLKKLLIDPSNAQTIEDEVTQTEGFKELLGYVEEGLLTPRERINDRQIEAVVKSIISEDLFVIQGPPGTGKSTAIAEIIWQHIRNDLPKEKAESYKVLVTSETNLAVDNALDKLRSGHHTLIKPIRFGSEEKLDKEGRRFSLEALENWLKDEEDEIDDVEESHNVNIIEDWIQQISERALACVDENVNPILSQWIEELNNPDENTRQLFFDIYTEHVNVIGATCSSIGKFSSTGWPTRFFNDYLSIYYPNIPTSKSRRKKISFNLVIQDEASKASPPELALPCIYGEKAIVIGDHRQLPPMVDTNEFKENLNYLKNKSKDKEYKKSIKRLIHTIENNTNSFETSHFETLFKRIPANLKTTFNLQYRMHPAINETIKQFYIEEGGLECGLLVPEDLGVDSPDLSNFASRYHGIDIENLLDTDTHVLWLNVDTPEYKMGTSRVNYGEIEAVDHLINQISSSEKFRELSSFWPDGLVEEKQIGVITFYGAQAGILTKLKEKYPKVPLRISPVDRFQGMERNIIIVSTVRSRSIADFPNQKPDHEKYRDLGYPAQSSLGFAEFPNRLNVALSRAKRLLIIVGNAEHFSQKEVYRNVLKVIKDPSNRHTRFIDYQSPKY